MNWKNRPKYGVDQVTELEVALRELREDRERQERERKAAQPAPAPSAPTQEKKV